MSHTVHPYAHRLGIIRDWRSRWFSVNKSYRDNLKADVLLREYLEKRLKGNYIDAIEFERGQNTFRIIIKTSRPGMVIGRSGEGSQKLRGDVIAQLVKWGMVLPKEIKLDIEEVRMPDTHAALVCAMIAEGLEKRLPFKRMMKQTVEKVLANRGVLGVKVTLSGRLGGAEIARTESLKRGRLPLQTLRADIDYATMRAQIPYGIGIKVWIYKGEVFESIK